MIEEHDELVAKIARLRRERDRWAFVTDVATYVSIWLLIIAGFAIGIGLILLVGRGAQ